MADKIWVKAVYIANCFVFLLQTLEEKYIYREIG